MENNIPHLGAVFDAPLIENGFCQRTKLLQSQSPETLQKLMSTDVRWFGFLIFSKLAQGLIQGPANKIVRCRRKSLVCQHDLLNSVREGEMTHRKIMIEAPRFVYGLGKSAPSGDEKEHSSDDQNENSLPPSQRPRPHGQIQFTIRPGTIMIFSIFFPEVQLFKLGWA